MATPPAAPILGMYNFGGAFSGPPSSWASGPTTNMTGQYFAMDDSTSWTDYGPAFVSSCTGAGLIPFAEIEPWNFSQDGVPFADILAGTWDAWLAGVGTTIAASGLPCMLTFGHEFNNSGEYPWAYSLAGFSHTGCGPSGGAVSAALWISTWKYVHDKVNSTAGGLALWMWAPGADTGGSTTTSPVSWWPGSGYVDMVGIDGYEALDGSPTTFNGVFASTLSGIRSTIGWTGDIFVSETNLALMVSGGGDSITTFVADMHAAGMSGIFEFEDSGLPLMTSGQWIEYNAAIVTYFGGGTVTMTGSAHMAAIRAGGQSGPITMTGSASLAFMHAGSPAPLIPQGAPPVPQIPAGWRPNQADFDLWVTRPLSFLAQPACFRAQLTTAESLSGGFLNLAQFNSVLEDPYGGWSATLTSQQAAWSWMCPAGCGGWYEATVSAFTTSQGGTAATIAPALFLNGTLWQYGSDAWAPSSGDAGSSGTVQVPLSPGDWVQVFLFSTATVTAPAVASQYPSVELTWVSS